MDSHKMELHPNSSSSHIVRFLVMQCSAHHAVELVSKSGDRSAMAESLLNAISSLTKKRSLLSSRLHRKTVEVRAILLKTIRVIRVQLLTFKKMYRIMIYMKGHSRCDVCLRQLLKIFRSSRRLLMDRGVN